MVKAIHQREWVQMEMKMNLPPLERVRRRHVKRRAELLWDEMQRKKRNDLIAPDKS